MKFIKLFRKFLIDYKLAKANAKLKAHSFSLSLWAELYNHLGTRTGKFDWMAQTMHEMEVLHEKIKSLKNEYIQVDNPCLSYETYVPKVEKIESDSFCSCASATF